MVGVLNRDPNWVLFKNCDPQGRYFISAGDFIRVILSSLV
jgi:hypothetical protein